MAIIAIAAFFEIFVFTMAASSLRFAFLNVTNIDMLKRPWVYQLAVRVANGTVPANQFNVVTYPLPRAGRAPGKKEDGSGTAGEPDNTAEALSPRDQLAQRTFAVLKTELGENPWDLGPWRNFQSVMGYNFIDWILPIHMSPCTMHDDDFSSDYEFGPVIDRLRERYNLRPPRERRHSSKKPTSTRREANGHSGGV